LVTRNKGPYKFQVKTLGPNELVLFGVATRKFDGIDLSFITQAGNDVVIGYKVYNSSGSFLETPIGPYSGPSIDDYLNTNYPTGGQVAQNIIMVRGLKGQMITKNIYQKK